MSLSFLVFPLSWGIEAQLWQEAGGAFAQCSLCPKGEVGGEERVFWEVENVMLAVPHERASSTRASDLKTEFKPLKYYNLKKKKGICHFLVLSSAWEALECF